MLYLTSQRRPSEERKSIYSSNRFHNWGSYTPMLSTAKLKATDLRAPKEAAIEHFEIIRENIVVRSTIHQDLEDAQALSSQRIFPIIAINPAADNVSIVSNVRDDAHSDVHRSIGDGETIQSSTNRSVDYTKCDLDPKVFPNGVKDLLVMFDL